MNDRIQILGCRGSMAVSGPQYREFGGATSSVLVFLAGQPVVIDAGTGILNLAKALGLCGICKQTSCGDCLSNPARGTDAAVNHIPLVLSHPHADHIMGLSMCQICFDKDYSFSIYGADRGGLSAKEQINIFMQKPIWPVAIDDLAAGFDFPGLSDEFFIGPVKLNTMEGEHPGGVSVIKLSAGGHTVVYASDCTLTDALRPRLAAFAKDCDVLLIDGQYTEEELEFTGGYGHNGCREAAAFGKECGAGKTLIIHHDIKHDDDMLRAMEADAKAENPDCSFAREGEEIEL